MAKVVAVDCFRYSKIACQNLNNVQIFAVWTANKDNNVSATAKYFLTYLFVFATINKYV